MSVTWSSAPPKMVRESEIFPLTFGQVVRMCLLSVVIGYAFVASGIYLHVHLFRPLWNQFVRAVGAM
jgi:hypothetical protein